MRTLDLGSLEIFRAVVAEGGVVRAAKKLHCVPSNVTTRVKQLEARLGVALFRRQGRTLALSPEGTFLLSYAERLFRLADEAETVLRSGEPRGVLRIGSLESTAGSRLPPLLARFHSLHPAVAVELVTGTTGALIECVARFELEAAFVSEPFTAPGLASVRAFDEELILITPRDLTNVKRPLDLAGRTLLAFPRGCSYRHRVEEWLGSASVVLLRTIDLGSYHAIVACVAAGTGFAVVPRSLLGSLRVGAGVRQHQLPPRVRRTWTHLVWSGVPSSSLARLTSLFASAAGGKGAPIP